MKSALIFSVFFLVSLYEKKQFARNYGNQHEFKYEKITVNDLAILYPLKKSTLPSMFLPHEGTGYCNLIDLESVFPSATSFIKNNFPLACGSQAASNYLKNHHSLSKNVNLAAEKSLDRRICRVENWKVVSIRTDPCLTVSKSGRCTGERMALVAQPIWQDDGGLNILDQAFHLLFKPNDFRFVLEKLTEIRNIQPPQSKEKPDLVLQPYPGLVREMDQCNGATSLKLKEFVVKVVAKSQLSEVSWMTTSLGQTEWTFSRNLRSTSGFKLYKQLEFDNFSFSKFVSGEFPLNKEFSESEKPSRISQFFSKNLRKNENSFIQALHKVDNPMFISQIDSGVACTTCHLVNKIRKENNWTTDLDENKVWHGFKLENRSSNNLREFGYWLNFEFGVSSRLIKEVLQDLSYLRTVSGTKIEH